MQQARNRDLEKTVEVVRDHEDGTWHGPGSPSTKQVLRGMWERTRKESNDREATRRNSREEKFESPACRGCEELQLRSERSEDEAKVTRADTRNRNHRQLAGGGGVKGGRRHMKDLEGPDR
jgi:hypothetical protein